MVLRRVVQAASTAARATVAGWYGDSPLLARRDGSPCRMIERGQAGPALVQDPLTGRLPIHDSAVVDDVGLAVGHRDATDTRRPVGRCRAAGWASASSTPGRFREPGL